MLLALAAGCGGNEAPESIAGSWRHASNPHTLTFTLRHPMKDHGDYKVVDESDPTFHFNGTWTFLTATRFKMTFVKDWGHSDEKYHYLYNSSGEKEYRITLTLDTLTLEEPGRPPEKWTRVASE